MKSLLSALQEGRLIELPGSDKQSCLTYLATLIEAIPDFRSGVDFIGAVHTREKAASTAIGRGWACPHGRVPGEGDMFCAIGWSPSGIDYAAPDGAAVRVVVMHYIPDSQKNAYLREISTLAKAIQGSPGLGEMSRAKDLGDARHRLIDLLTAALETALPDAKARMIQLEARQAVAALGEALTPETLATLSIIPLSIFVAPSLKPLVLSQDREIAAALEADAGLSTELLAGPPAARSFDRAGYRVVTRSVSTFQPDRLLYDCIAVKLPGIPQQKR
jgi:mannitol/fructose-specific phosphotransferase system IIA component (Ntr-type)